MSDITVMLGPISLRSFEVPNQINVGGRQHLAVHRLTDGRRVIDSLGRDDTDISFRGILSGPDATMRARLLDVLRVAGDPLPLTWDVFYYTVILTRFDAMYQNRTWIPYRVVCTVLRDEASTVIPAPVSLGTSLLGDLSAAAAQGIPLPSDFTGVQTSLAAPYATTRDTSAYATAQSEMLDLQSGIAIQVTECETSLQYSVGVPSLSPQDAVVDLLTIAQSVQQLAMLTTARAYVGRASLNLNNAST